MIMVSPWRKVGRLERCNLFNLDVERTGKRKNQRWHPVIDLGNLLGHSGDFTS
jgi:hypothetical protein